MDNSINILHKKQSGVDIKSVLKYVFLFCILLVQLFPLYWLLVLSLKSNTEIFAGKIISLPSEWLFSNYLTVLKNGAIVRYFFNSLFVTGITVVTVVLLSAMSGYAIVRLKWKLAKPVLIIFLMGIMIPYHATLLPLFVLLRKAHMLNSYLALIFPYIALGLPFGIYIYTGFLDTIPLSMEESVVMDGGSLFLAFKKVIFPLASPAAATVAILTLLTVWNELMFAVVFINKNEFMTLPVGILSFTSKYRTNWGSVGAAMMVGVLPVLILYSLISKQIQKSIMQGAIKG